MERSPGARGRDRTTDTAIFSRMLYQLSYPGFLRSAPENGARQRAEWPRYRKRFRDCPAGRDGYRNISLAGFSEWRLWGAPCPVVSLNTVFLVHRRAWNRIAPAEPAAQIDIRAALGAEWAIGRCARLAADGAGACGGSGRAFSQGSRGRVRGAWHLRFRKTGMTAARPHAARLCTNDYIVTGVCGVDHCRGGLSPPQNRPTPRDSR